MHGVTYKHLPGPVGDCLKPASYATTATIPVSFIASLLYTTGPIGLRLTWRHQWRWQFSP